MDVVGPICETGDFLALDRSLPMPEPGALMAIHTVGAYGFWRAHVRSLLAEAAVPGPDALVDALLAPLAAEVFRFQRASGVAPAQVADALARLARRVLAGGSCPLGLLRA
jgi:hypothetical protein